MGEGLKICRWMLYNINVGSFCEPKISKNSSICMREKCVCNEVSTSSVCRIRLPGDHKLITEGFHHRACQGLESFPSNKIIGVKYI